MPLPGIPFLKSSSGTAVSSRPPPDPPARPPSPLSAANFGSSSKRPTTASSSAARKTSASRATPSITSASSISGTSLSSRTLAATAEQQPTPPLSQSSRSLSSRLLRRRPSEKTSLARTPRLPALVSAASESDGPSEPLTGSTTGADVFADQQDMWGAMPLMSVEDRRASEIERAQERVGRLSMSGSGEAGSWRSGETLGNPWLRRVSDGSDARASVYTSSSVYPVSSESPFYMKTGYTALPPPPRPGARRYDPAEKEEVIAESLPSPQCLPWDLWGRRTSDPVQYAARLASLPDNDFPKGHPFLQSYTSPVALPALVKSDSDRESALATEKQNNDSGRSRFGDAPPLPPHPSRDDKPVSSPAKRPPPKSPRSGRAISVKPESGFTPPPRSSSRLNDASAQFDANSSPSLSSFSSSKSSLPASRKPYPSRLRSNSVSSTTASRSPQHILAPLPDTFGSPAAPLQYQLVSRSPKSTSSIPHLEHSAVLSPSRAPRFTVRSSDQQSLVSGDDADSESEEEGDYLQAQRIRHDGYEVSVACIGSAPEANGEVKWEVILRPSVSKGISALAGAQSVRLNGPNPIVTAAPAGATHVTLTLAMDKADGNLSFVHPTIPSSHGENHATPTRRRRGNNDYHTGFSGRAAPNAWGSHDRQGTFGMGETKPPAAARVYEADGEPPFPSSVSLASVEEENKFDRRRTVTPPPRMSTPPPMPSQPHVNTTPISSTKKRQAHSRSTSYGDGPQVWALSPAAATPTAANSGGTRTPPRCHTPRELTYVSSPSPRGTPRRTRLVSASQLNGGLFAHGTVDGLSEQDEGLSV